MKVDKNIPIFPNFKKIAPEDISLLNTFVLDFPPYSEFSPVTILSWNYDNSSLYSFLDNNLILQTKDEFHENHIITFLGSKNQDQVLNSISKLNIPICLVPAESLIGINTQNFHIIKNPNNYDYIYDLEELSLMQGKCYAKKRNIINRFKRTYKTVYTSPLTIEDPNNHDKINEINDKWIKYKSGIKFFDCRENKAINNLFKLTQFLNIISFGLYDNGEMIGYIIYEKHASDWVIGHFMKSDPKYENANDYLVHETATALLTMNFKYLNLEQDLGFNGLKISKKAWNPKFYLEKSNITLE